MAQTRAGLEGRLEQVTARLEQAVERNQGGGFTSALKPFVLGALAGAGLALLYAPQPGAQTRTVLQRNANDLQQRATQAASSVKEQLPAQKTAVQDKVRTLLAQTKQQATTATGPGEETPPSAKAEAEAGAGAKRGTGASTASTAKKRAVDGSQAEDVHAQLRRDLQTGSENPA